MPFADLHLHTSHSDGSDTPDQVVARAAALDIAALAITDHDTVAGVDAAAAATAAAGITFLSGVEISTSSDRQEVHVVGLGIDIASPPLASALSELRRLRETRVVQMVERLQAASINISLDTVRAESGGGALGRMHVALALRTLGITRSTQEGFNRFLKPGRPGFASKGLLPARSAVDAIHAAGGLAFVAHPGLGKTTRRLLPRLLTLPFDGIEAHHVSHNPGRTEEFLLLARENGLLVAGGSDCHGTVKGKPEMGKVRVPLDCVEAIQDRLVRSV